MKKKNWSIVIIACVVMLVLFAYFGGRMAAAEPAFSFAEEPCEVYLTFDDGPSTVVTNRILDTLAEENVKAAFFIVGERVPGREETLRRIAREGHTLGVHSMTHRYREIYASPEAFLNDVNGCAEVIRKTTGVEPKFYRFPGGGKQESSFWASAAASMRRNGPCSPTSAIPSYRGTPSAATRKGGTPARKNLRRRPLPPRRENAASYF